MKFFHAKIALRLLHWGMMGYSNLASPKNKFPPGLSISNAKWSFFYAKIALRLLHWGMMGYSNLASPKNNFPPNLSISNAKWSFFHAKIALRLLHWGMMGYSKLASPKNNFPPGLSISKAKWAKSRVHTDFEENLKFSVPEKIFKNRSEMMSYPPGFSEICNFQRG